jgi:site-specific DNA-methyltransferase (adenine-specific)
MTSNSDEWTTPSALFRALDRRFGFELDPAATKENALCPMFFTKEDSGLLKSWRPWRTFVNPPYSAIGPWMQKCISESEKGCPLICALIPARTDTHWWYEYAMSADLIHFVKGRLKFGDGLGSAPFPSALAFWFGLGRLKEEL